MEPLAPFNATAFASWRGGTTSATIACQAGLLIDPPRPSAKVRSSNATGVARSAKVSQLRTPAATSIQVWHTSSSRRRSTRSASAPAGRPTRRTGRLVAVCINATRRGEGVNVVISQATPTFCIHVPTLDTTDAIHMARNAATASGLQAASRTRGLLTICARGISTHCLPTRSGPFRRPAACRRRSGRECDVARAATSVTSA